MAVWRHVKLSSTRVRPASPMRARNSASPSARLTMCASPSGSFGGALPEVVGTSEETGLLVPPNDPEALAHMVKRALGDAELRARIGEAGRTRVLDSFTWRQTAIGTVENYRILLEDRAAGRTPGRLPNRV